MSGFGWNSKRDSGGTLLIDPDTEEKTDIEKDSFRYKVDIVLGASPEAYEAFGLFDSIVDMAGKRLQLGIYSPHKDRMEGRRIDEIMRFATDEAIPGARLVIPYWGFVDSHSSKMFEVTMESRKPFVILRPEGKVNPQIVNIFRENNYFKGEVVYKDQDNAIAELEKKLRELQQVLT